MTWAEKQSSSITAQSVNKSITVKLQLQRAQIKLFHLVRRQVTFACAPCGSFFFPQRERKQTKHSNTTKSSFPVGFRPKKTNGSCGRTLKLTPLHTRPVYQSDRSIAPGGGVRSISDRWETFGLLWSVVLVNAGRTGCEKKRDLPDSRSTFLLCFWVCVCVLCDEFSQQAVCSSLSCRYPRSWQRARHGWDAADSLGF